MDIQSWFDSKGSYTDGVALYSRLPHCNQSVLRRLQAENAVNFLTLKYELKLALEKGIGATTPQTADVAPQPKKTATSALFLKDIIQQSVDAGLKKENMAMYPPELHGVYRDRINCFYKACELKFKLNAVPDADEDTALAIIIELEELWATVDRCWMILGHWKEHKRIMPVAESEDFSQLNGIQLVKKRDALQAAISKRSKTIEGLEVKAESAPEDRVLINNLNRKKEQLQQLVTDLEVIRSILQKE